MSDEKIDRPKKLQRISQACDLCHRRSIRCRPSAEVEGKCQNCVDFGVQCLYERPSRRKRKESESLATRRSVLTLQPAAGSASQPTAAQAQAQSSTGPSIGLQQPSPQLQHQLPPQPADAQSRTRVLVSPGVSDARGFRSVRPFSQDASPYSSSVPSQFDPAGAFAPPRDERPDVLGTAWRAFTLASLESIEYHLGVYIEVVYPLYPLFHPPTLWGKVHNREHVEDEGFFASIMAACALAAARARDGARGERSEIDSTTTPSSEVFFIAAQDMVSRELHRAGGLGFLRACGLLALTAIQYGEIALMHLFMGHYHTLCDKLRFYDESHWPMNTTVIEKEERRRLFWTMYNLEVSGTLIFDSVMRNQEIFSNVQYPSEDDDDQLMSGAPSAGSHASWMRGWNFCIDLSRVLEYAVKRLRRHRHVLANHFTPVQLIAATGSTERQVLDILVASYTQLPERLKDYRPLNDHSRDVYKYQAINIQATLQLVRMTLVAAEMPINVEARCQVMEQVLTTFHGISKHLLRDMSVPLIHLLGCVARLSLPPLEGMIGEQLYRRLRSLGQSMFDFLVNMESSLHVPSGVTQALHLQMAQLDRYMEAQRQLLSSASASGPSQVLRPDTARMMSAHHGRLNENMGVAAPIEGFHITPDLVPDATWGWPGVQSHDI